MRFTAPVEIIIYDRDYSIGDFVISPLFPLGGFVERKENAVYAVVKPITIEIWSGEVIFSLLSWNGHHATSRRKIDLSIWRMEHRRLKLIFVDMMISAAQELCAKLGLPSHSSREVERSHRQLESCLPDYLILETMSSAIASSMTVDEMHRLIDTIINSGGES